MLFSPELMRDSSAGYEQQDLDNKQPVYKLKNHWASILYSHRRKTSPVSGKAESAKRI